MIVYKISNTQNDKVYIGVTKNTLSQRWSKHLHDCNYGSQNLLYKAMRKYGTINFNIEIIDSTATSLEDLERLEKYYIEKYNSANPDYGYNSVKGNYLKEYVSSGKSPITDVDVIFIRTKYKEGLLRCRDCYNKYFKDKLSFSGFQRIWEGVTWMHIMPEIYTPEAIEYHKKQLGHKGEKNPNAKLSDKEVLEIRKYFVNHTMKECYEVFGKGVYTLCSFKNITSGVVRKNIPQYRKYSKKWILNNVEIDINNYNPVSTISESGE